MFNNLKNVNAMKRLFNIISKAISPHLVVVALALFAGNIMAQIAVAINPKMDAIAQPGSTRNWINFREGTNINPNTIFNDFNEAFELNTDDQMRIIKIEKDEFGFNHFRYQQYYKNLKVVYGEFIVHQQPDGFVKSANGRLITGLNQAVTPALNEEQALQLALNFMNAKKYLWQNPEMEGDLKRQEKDNNASYFPVGELVFSPNNYEATFGAQDYSLAWNFRIYTDDPEVTAKSVYVDAKSGTIIHHTDIAMNCSTGSGNSAFNSAVSFSTEFSGTSFRSHNDCQTTDIYVFNCGGGGAVNTYYTDADNAWTAASAVQAQWGALQTYNYYIGEHSRASWNGASGDMIAYNNAFSGQNNACWGCTGNSTIFYAGNTASATDDWNTNDIMGHEFTHGVTQASANLVYNKESGALNESFSDIFGEMVESWSEGSCDYLVGADRGAIRSFINPNLYGDPDTYNGTNYVTTVGCVPANANDQCGVHTNSGVQNRYFHLLSEGGSGTTDFGVAYNVTGISRFKARQIQYRALTFYLNSSSQFIDARAASLAAAWDLYGQCSQEIISVGDAWHAVGVESQSAQFSKNFCGNYPASGTFMQAISLATAANGCATTITPSATNVYFTARDNVILYPGFIAQAGSNFTAYLEPCSSTMWRTSSEVNMSDAEKGITNSVQAIEDATANATADNISISPNPFNSTFELDIKMEKGDKAKIEIYNALGMKVKEVMDRDLSEGINRIHFDAGDMAQGVYMLEVKIGDTKSSKRIVKR